MYLQNEHGVTMLNKAEGELSELELSEEQKSCFMGFLRFWRFNIYFQSTIA